MYQLQGDSRLSIPLKILFLAAMKTTLAISSIAFALLLVTLAVNVSMPLFQMYAENAHYGTGKTALILAAYIGGMLPSYIFLGGLSDRLGRKSVLLLSVGFAFLSTALITWQPNMVMLPWARVCQGIALALSMGTGTAYMAELLPAGHATQAANKASLATAIGFSGGALATTISLAIHFSFTPISYFILLMVTGLGGLWLLRLPEVPAKGGSFIRLPYFPPGCASIHLSVGLCWAATGTIIALIPAELSRLGWSALAGLCLVLINWSGAAIQWWVRRMVLRHALFVGFALIPVGFGVVVWGVEVDSIGAMLLGTGLCGLAAYGFSYVSGLAFIAQLSGPEKSRAVSGYMMSGYIGFGIPAIFLGYWADISGMTTALVGFEVVLLVLTGLSLFLFQRYTRPALRPTDSL